MKTAYIKASIIAVVLLLAVQNIQAQTYQLLTKQQPYKYLTAALAITRQDTAWTSVKKTIDLGFNFNGWAGRSYNKADIGRRDLTFLTPGDSVATYIAISMFQTSGSVNQKDKGVYPGPSKSFVTYKLEGTIGDRILKIEYRNMGINTADPKDSLNYQLWIYEKNNDVEWHWGPSYIADPQTVFTKNPGTINGIATANYKHELLDIAYIVGEVDRPKLFSNNKVALPVDTGTVGYPHEGTVYRLTRLASGISPIAINTNVQLTPVGENRWRVNMKNIGKIPYQIFNVVGQQVESGIASDNTEVSLQNYSDGIYILNLVSKEGPISTKLIKK